MDVKVRAFGEFHEDVAVGFYNFGKLAIDMENFDQALVHFERALYILVVIITFN